MAARPITLSNHAYIEWSSQFDCDEADEDKVITQVRDGVLIPGLKALEQRFAIEATTSPSGVTHLTFTRR